LAGKKQKDASHIFYGAEPVEEADERAFIAEQAYADLPKRISEEALLEQVFDKTITDQDIADAEANKPRDEHGSRELFDDSKIELKTELSPVEIIAISRLRFMANRYNIPAFHDFTDDVMKLKVSHRRQGRKEFIQGLHAEEKNEKEKSSGSAFDFLMSKVGLGGGGGE